MAVCLYKAIILTKAGDCVILIVMNQMRMQQTTELSTLTCVQVVAKKLKVYSRNLYEHYEEIRSDVKVRRPDIVQLLPKYEF